jgi:thymidine kinase
MNNKNPKFIMYVGPMFSGKTSRLLSLIDRYTYQNKAIIAFKPKMDDRYTAAAIQTHSGAKIDAITVNSGKDILQHLLDANQDFDIVAVDEAFMIDNSSDALIHLFKLGKTIIISSLEMSATCTPFDEITAMTPWATHIEKCPSVCVVCQKDAYYTQKKDDVIKQIHVGGADLYEPRCWGCHSYINNRDI